MLFFYLLLVLSLASKLSNAKHHDTYSKIQSSAKIDKHLSAPIKVIEKSLKITDSPGLNLLCPSFSDGIYILLQPVSLAGASSSCLDFGLGLANLTFNNNFVASQLLKQCGANIGWLSSFERVRSNTCVVLTGDGDIFYPDNQSCQNSVNVAICQDFANTVVTTATTTLSFCTKETVTFTLTNLSTATVTDVSTTVSINAGDPMTSGCGGGGCVVTHIATYTPAVSTVMVTVTTGFTTVMLKALDTTTEMVSVVTKRLELHLSTIVNPVTVSFVPPVESKTCPKNNASCGMNIGFGEFVLIKSFLPFSQASCACEQMNMKLAEIDQDNFNDATDALYKCGGSFSSGWIRSFNNDKHNGLCLGLYASDSAVGGSIDYPGSCSTGLYVLCQKKPTDWNSNNFPSKYLEITKSNNFKSKNPKKAFIEFQDPVYSLCSTTQNGFFIVSSQSYLPNQNYDSACSQFNLQPANINSSNRGAAGVVFSICSNGDSSAAAAIVNSFENLQGSVCDLVDDNAAIMVVNNQNGVVASICATNRYFLCQNTNAPSPSASTIFTGPFVYETTTTVPQTTISTILTSSTVTMIGTTTTTTTEVEFISLTVTTQISVTTTTLTLTSGQIITVTTTDVSTVTPVVPTCPAQMLQKSPMTNGFVVLKDKAKYWECECACKAHGLKLAELDSSNFLNASEAIRVNLGSFQKAWIKKYSSQSFGEQCLAIYTGAKSDASVLPMYCDVPIPVVCQQQQ